jgi:O-antigen/teichoic acid export membrane protein
MKNLWVLTIVVPLVALGLFYFIRKQKNEENKELYEKFWFILTMILGSASVLSLLIAYSISDKIEYLLKMSLPLLIILIPFMNNLKRSKKTE